MLFHCIRIVDIGQCFFLIMFIFMKSLIKDKGMYQEIIITCLIYFIESHMVELLSRAGHAFI
ncbi:hypothetical protein A8A01_15160 [Ewingella americana]|nr:hypothetical protein A8A01_15160 [Ewingella americana]